jgi:hypothetical protein
MGIGKLETPCLGIQVEKEKRTPEFQQPFYQFGLWTCMQNAVLLLVANHLDMKLNLPALATNIKILIEKNLLVSK